MLLRDLRQAGRALRRSPVFTVTSVGTIALVIGAAAAVFSVTNAVLLRPLPYRDPGRLVLACADLRSRSVKDLPFSNATFLDLQNGMKTVFDEMAAVTSGQQILRHPGGSSERILFSTVTPNFFRVLGAKIIAGRDFEEIDGDPSSQPAAILSHEYWQRRYGGDAGVIGRGMAGDGSSGPSSPWQ